MSKCVFLVTMAKIEALKNSETVRQYGSNLDSTVREVRNVASGEWEVEAEFKDETNHLLVPNFTTMEDALRTVESRNASERMWKKECEEVTRLISMLKN